MRVIHTFKMSVYTKKNSDVYECVDRINTYKKLVYNNTIAHFIKLYIIFL